ncbi:hypothetical protein V9T40_014488 [Parthenolecanium corni]|uniref:Uncharacterized protein n=1 Tax=Parthenolecanium corni TaxID=536013 RepID=A0AAN9T5Y6_9HEMI
MEEKKHTSNVMSERCLRLSSTRVPKSYSGTERRVAKVIRLEGHNRLTPRVRSKLRLRRAALAFFRAARSGWPVSYFHSRYALRLLPPSAAAAAETAAAAPYHTSSNEATTMIIARVR